MELDAYEEYPKRAYCRAVTCPVQGLLDQEVQGSTRYDEIRKICQTGCLQTSHALHSWLIKEGYLVIRPKAGQG